MQLMPMLRHRSLNKTPSENMNKDSGNYNVNVYQQQQPVVPGDSTERVLRITKRAKQNKPRKEKTLKPKGASI